MVRRSRLQTSELDDQSHQIYTSFSVLIPHILYTSTFYTLSGPVRARVEFKHTLFAPVEPPFVLVKCLSSRSPLLLLFLNTQLLSFVTTAS